MADGNNDPAPPPNEAILTGAGWVSLAALAFVLGSLVVLVGLAAAGWYEKASSDPQAQATLLGPWSFFLWLVVNGDLVGHLAGGILAVLGLGFRIVSKGITKVWPGAALLAACLAGFVLSLVLMWLLSEGDGLVALRSFTAGDGTSLTARVNLALGLVAAWFVVLAQRHVGIEKEKEVVERILAFFRGNR